MLRTFESCVWCATRLWMRAWSNLGSLHHMTARAGSVVTYNPNNSSIDSTDFYYAFANAYSGGYSALRLVPGTYTIINPFGGFHFIAGCYSAQRVLFELDLGGSTFVLTVSLRLAWPAAVSASC